MRFQFTIARLMYSTAIIAVGLGLTSWALGDETSKEWPAIRLLIFALAPLGCIGGAIGALYGKALDGAAYGLSLVLIVLPVILGVLFLLLVLVGTIAQRFF
jgi:hypothetical protein